MATLTEEAMDSYMYSAYTPYPYRYLNPKSKAGSWRQRNYLANYAAADNGDYFDNYQRAQLKAILSQVNPNLTPRLRKANTRDVGVQVNPRQDASVQCSLGPRTLTRRRRGLLRRGPQQEPELPEGTPASEPPKTVRFRRTIAVYSPVASRRLTTTFQEKDEGDAPGESGKSEDVETQAEEAPQPDPRLAEEASSDAAEKSEEKPDAEEVTAEEGTALGSEEGMALGSDQQEAAADKSRVRFQFLEQKYGYYHCKECNIRWESAYVWCVQGTNKVYFRQFCRACQKTFNPYRVEDITCQTCRQTRCTCPVKLRHVDPKRPHRQDLCGRCKGKRLSCDSTFSFKYII